MASNWDNVEGFWDGASTFFTGAGAGVAVCFTGGMSFWAGAGIIAGSSALVGFNNDIVRQTDKNFKGFGDVNWGEVGVSTAASGIGGFAAYGAGYWAVQSPVINSIRSPLLKSTLLAPIGSAAGHIAGGTAAGTLSGQDFDIAFGNSFRGLGSSIALGTITGLVTTAAVSRAQGINPVNGKYIRSASPVYQTTINNLINESNPSPTQKGTIQGFVDMDINGTFELLKTGGESIPSTPNMIRYPDGTIIYRYNSTTDGSPTLHINKSGEIYKIRFKP